MNDKINEVGGKNFEIKRIEQGFSILDSFMQIITSLNS